MRFTRSSIIGAALFCLLPAGGFAASKEMQELQRDVAQLQGQVQSLQSSIDQKMGALQVLTQQARDAGASANTGVSALTSNVNQTLERELKQSLVPVASLAAKVDNTNNDMAEVRNQVAELNNSVNKILQMLGDLNTAVRVLQGPAAAPPPGTGFNTPPGSGGPPLGASPLVASPMTGSPGVPAATLFGNAVRDYNGGKLDLALSEYADFVRFYPDDPNAAAAQLNIGEVHYAQNKLDLAVKDFDAVIERYSDNAKITPDAYFMKGMALKQSAKRDAAASTFRALIAKFPRSDKSDQAKEQLRAMGFNLAEPAAAAKRRR